MEPLNAFFMVAFPSPSPSLLHSLVRALFCCEALEKRILWITKLHTTFPSSVRLRSHPFKVQWPLSIAHDLDDITIILGQICALLPPLMR